MIDSHSLTRSVATKKLSRAQIQSVIAGCIVKRHSVPQGFSLKKESCDIIPASDLVRSLTLQGIILDLIVMQQVVHTANVRILPDSVTCKGPQTICPLDSCWCSGSVVKHQTLANMFSFLQFWTFEVHGCSFTFMDLGRARERGATQLNRFIVICTD